MLNVLYVLLHNQNLEFLSKIVDVVIFFHIKIQLNSGLFGFNYLFYICHFLSCFEFKLLKEQVNTYC